MSHAVQRLQCNATINHSVHTMLLFNGEFSDHFLPITPQMLRALVIAELETMFLAGSVLFGDDNDFQGLASNASYQHTTQSTLYRTYTKLVDYNVSICAQATLLIILLISI